MDHSIIHIDDCVCWIMYRARSIGCHRSGLSDCVEHSGALGKWWYISCDEHIHWFTFHVSTLIYMLLMFLLSLWIYCEGRSLFVNLYPLLLSIDLFVWQLGKSVSCPLSLWICITIWVEYRDPLWTLDLILYHIKSMHYMCIDPWGRSADMIVEI